MRRVGRLLALLVLALAGPGAPPASAGVADRIGASFALILADFVKAAAPVEGIVVSAGEDGRIYLDLGEGSGVAVGQELTVFRKGEAFHHPITGKPLGRYEEVLGYAQVRRIAPAFSEGRFVPVPGQPAPRPEDGVRITRGRIRVAVTPALDLTDLKGDLRRVPFLLSRALEGSRRFLVNDPLAMTDMFANGLVRVEEVLGRPDRAVALGKEVEVTGWVVPVLLERGGVPYLDVTWISAVTGTALFSRRVPLVPVSELPGQRFPWEPRFED